MQNLDVKPGMKIKFTNPTWWSEAGVVWTVEHAERYSEVSSGVLLKLEGRNYNTIVSRNTFEIVEE